MKRLFVISLALLLLLFGCSNTAELPAVPDDVKIVPEQPVTGIPLAGPVSEAEAEISGLTC